jgi:hypothetical protein
MSTLSASARTVQVHPVSSLISAALAKSRSSAESDAVCRSDVPAEKVAAGVAMATDDAAVTEIAEMICQKYVDDGERNFAIGQRAYEHAQWQHGHFAEYTPAAFDSLMRRIRDEARTIMTIEAKSTRVSDWVRCHVLRTLVREVIGDDLAGKLSYGEYIHLIGSALHFSKKDVEGVLVEG